MNLVKILQCADIHLDTSFSELSKSVAELRREELRETFGNMIDLAKKEKVQIMLLCGDLFDNSNIMRTTIDYLLSKFNEIPDIQIFISPGNHDPYYDKSFYNTVKWPDNVHIFKHSLDNYYIEALNTTVYGIGFDKAHEKNSLLKGFKAANSNSINIMAMHGEVCSENVESLYNPIRERDIENSELDYLALGHVHTYSGIKKSGKTYWAYSGNPEGRGFDEQGPKGLLIGDIGKDSIDLNYRTICKRQYIEKEVDISGCKSYEDITIKLNESIGMHDYKEDIEKNFKEKEKNLYKFELVGNINTDFNINTFVLEEKLKNSFFYAKVVNNTAIAIDYDNLSQEYSLKGIYTRKMLDKIDKEEKEEEKQLLREALKLGLRALDLKEVTPNED